MLVQDESDKQGSASQEMGGDTNDNMNESDLNAPEEITSFRADAAKGKYWKMDRPDLQFSAKEIPRDMSNPTKRDQRKIATKAT